MIAAHPWDLRAATAQGLHTAYIQRAGEGSPEPSDTFDLTFLDLDRPRRTLAYRDVKLPVPVLDEMPPADAAIPDTLQLHQITCQSPPKIMGACRP